MLGQEDEGEVCGEQLGGGEAGGVAVDDYLDTGDYFCSGVRGGELKFQYHVIFFDGKGNGWSMSTELGRRFERMVEEFSSKRLCHVHRGRRSSREED